MYLIYILVCNKVLTNASVVLLNSNSNLTVPGPVAKSAGLNALSVESNLLSSIPVLRHMCSRPEHSGARLRARVPSSSAAPTPSATLRNTAHA
jgi:hypothetical protein